MRILVIEDEDTVRRYIAKGLEEHGHTVDQAKSGRDGLFLATTESFDAIVLDRMLPEMDGMTILKTLRASDITTPVLIVSALGEVDDRVEGLKTGSDDYLIKPFQFSELMARVEVIAKRHASPHLATESTLSVDDLKMDLVKRKVTKSNQQIEFQPREFSLLEFLMRHKGQLITRTMLLEKVWNYHFDPETNVIDVHISRIRNKIDNKDGASFIETVRGSGYRFREG